MDMAPPQAPPAFTSSQNQAAVDTVARLAHAQAWLAEQQSAMPTVAPLPALDGEAAFLAELTDFWNAPVAVSPGTDPVSRATAFARRQAAVMGDTAALRGDDNTLDERAVSLARAFARSVDQGLPTGILASELLIGDVPYAGAVVLQADGAADLALLFSPDGGWEAFDSLEHLHARTERRMREALAGVDELPGISRDDVERVADDAFVSSRRVDAGIFVALVRRVAAIQEERVADAWSGYAAGVEDAATLADRVRDALDLHDHLDINALMAHRDARLAQALQHERLAQVPADVRGDWTAARASYRAQLLTAAERRRSYGMAELESIDDFATRNLSVRLKEQGIENAPSDIVIRVTPLATTPFQVVSHLFNGAETRRVGLTELAYQNIGAMESATLAAETIEGTSLALGGDAIRAMVREVNLVDRYTTYLEDTLRVTPVGQASRSIAVALQQARLAFELEDARLSYYLADEPRSFPHGDIERGYRWMKAVVDAPGSRARPRVEGHEIVARQLTYRGAAFSDLFEVGVRSEGSSSRVVYYTPGAPDGITIREFGSREEAARGFFYNPAFEPYLLAHLPTGFSEVSSNGQRRFKVSDAARIARWTFAQDGGGAYTRMEEAIGEREIGGDLFDASYDASLALMRNNVAALGRSTGAADWRAALVAVDAAVSAGQPVSNAVAYIGTSSLEQVAGLFPSLWRMYDNIKAGDHPQAFLDMVEAYHASLNVVGLNPFRPVRLPGFAVRSQGHARSLLETRQRVPDPDTLFEPRFLAQGTAKQDADALIDGVYRIRGGRYIEQDSKLYAVRFDATTASDTGTGTWRLTRSGAPDAAFSGPAIERTADGGWRHTRQIGLRGGSGHPRKLRPDALPTRNQRFDPRLLSMSSHQRSVMSRLLLTLLGDDRVRAARVYRSMSRATPAQRGHFPPVSDADRLAYRRAMEEGQAAPRDNPVPAPRVVVPGVQVRSATVAAPPVPSVPAPRPPTLPLIASAEIRQLPPTEWPSSMWVYLAPADLAAYRVSDGLRLPQVLIGQGQVRGVAGLTLPPATLIGGLPGVPARVVTPGATLGSTAGAWVNIDLHRLRTRVGMNGQPLYNVFQPRAAGSTGIVLTPRPLFADIRSLRDIWIYADEFQTGEWTVPR